jgi:hypothetical protein
MNNIYFKKYLKYKKKYLKLKQFGGDIFVIQELIDTDISKMNLDELKELEKKVVETRDKFCGFELLEKPLECENLQIKRIEIKNKITQMNITQMDN